MIIEEKLLNIKCKVKYCGNAIINIIAAAVLSTTTTFPC